MTKPKIPTDAERAEAVRLLAETADRRAATAAENEAMAQERHEDNQAARHNPTPSAVTPHLGSGQNG